MKQSLKTAAARSILGLLCLLLLAQSAVEAQNTKRPDRALEGARTDVSVKSDAWASANDNIDTVFIAVEPGTVRAFLYHRQGVVKETGLLVNGQKEGEWRRYSSTGMPESYMTFRNGVPNGGAYSFFPNGFIKLEANFKNGLKDGYYRSYSQVAGKSTLKSEAVYKDDKYHGTFIQYMENGNRMQQATYDNGVKEGVSIWYYSNNRKALEQEYKNGQLEGKQTAYFETGKVQTVSHHANNALHGSYENYFASGQLESKGEYKNGKRHGKWEFYAEDGSLLRTEDF